MMKRVVILALVITFSFFIPVVSSIDVTSCTATLSESNNTYVLTTNLNSSITCLTIVANNITLNLNGYNITANSGVQSSNTAIFLNGANNTKVYNGSITDYSFGIRTLRSLDNSFYNLTIASNKLANDHSLYGINIDVGSARNNLTNINVPYLINTDTTGAVAGDNDCNQPYNSYGVCIYLSPNSSVKDFTVSNLSARTLTYGILIEDANNTYVNNYTVNLSKTYGIYIDASSFIAVSNFSTFTNQSSNTAFIISVGSYNILNSIYSFGSAVALTLSGSSHNIVKDANLFNTSQTSIFVSTGLNNTLNNVSVRNTNVSFPSLSVGVSSNFTTFVDGYYENYSLGGLGSFIIINKTGFGEIRFLQLVNGTGTNFSNDINIRVNNASVASSSNPGLNRSANITLIGLATDFILPRIYKDGSICVDCSNFTSLNSGRALFNVSSFSQFSIDHNDSFNPIVNLISPSNGETVTSASRTFNATFAEEAALVNATFYLWNSTLDIINQTFMNITGTSNTSTLEVTLPYEGTFYWNYFIFDSSYNGASNNTNFSFTYAIPASSSGGSSGGGGGGGGAGIVRNWTFTYNHSDKDLVESFLHVNLGVKNRASILVNGQLHHVGILNISPNSVSIEVSSLPQRGDLVIGESLRFELTGDTYYDLSVTLLAIENNRANLLLEHLQEVVEEPPIQEENNSETNEESSSSNFPVYYIGIGAVIFILVLVMILVMLYKRRKKLTNFNS